MANIFVSPAVKLSTRAPYKSFKLLASFAIKRITVIKIMQVYPALINRVADLICRKKCKTIPIITVKEPAQYSTIPVLFARGAGSYVFFFSAGIVLYPAIKL